MSIFKRKDPSVLQTQMQAFDKKSGGFESDATEWRLTRDKKTGAGSAVLRFLPAVKDDATTFVKLVSHGFQKNGKWYIENCHSTHGDWDTCPACAWLKAQNWDYNVEADRNAMYGSGVTRKVNYWANVLVIKDPANPENEGKVFKWRFGKKILDKINAQINVDTELGEEPCDVTCPFEGKNFILKCEQVGGHPNYDKSQFQDKRTPIANIEDEAYQTKLFDQMQDLMAIIAKDKFKSKEELETAFNRVMGGAAGKPKTATDDFEDQMNAYDAKPQAQSKPAPAEKSEFDKDDEKFNDADLDDLLNDL